MRIAVTGAAGKLGRAVVPQLVEAGHDLIACDLVGGEVHGVPVNAADLTDPRQAEQAVAGVDALLHLAAIPVSHPEDPYEVVRTNVLSTFNVVEAALRAGVARVVLASSGSIYGPAWSPTFMSFASVPVTEATPLTYVDEYALTKDVLELCGRMASRRGAISFGLRFHAVVTAEEARAGVGQDDNEGLVRGLWGFVEIGDAARACVLALAATAEGLPRFAPLLVVSDEVLSHTDSEVLLSRHYPPVEHVGTIEGRQGLFDCSLAASEIGWRPRFRLFEPAEADPSPPVGDVDHQA